MIMPDQNNMDSMFQRLNELERRPSPGVWEGIESHLARKGKRRRLVPLLRWGAAAAVVLAAGLFGLFSHWEFGGPDAHISYVKNVGQPALFPNQQDSLDKQGDPMPVSDAEETLAQVAPLREQDQDMELLPEAGKKLPETKSQSAFSSKEERDKTGQVFTDHDAARKLPARMTPRKLNPLREVLAQYALAPVDVFFPDEKQKSDAAKGSSNKRSLVVGGEYSPTYAFRNVSGPTSGASRESGMMTGGGGFRLTLRMDARWEIETGLNYARLGQEVSAVTRSNRVYGLMPSEGGLDVTDVQLDNTMGAIQRDHSPVIRQDARTFSADANEIVKLSSEAGGQSSAQLEQLLGYMKVPLTLRYRVLEANDWNVSLSGGLSANWLVDNDAYLSMSGERQYLGRTRGLSGTSFSTHAGIAVGIPVTSRIKLRMEPRIDYFISDISEASPVRYQPYSFGVFTGVFYEF